ncbi:conserved protein of unknown function [Tenacibaculum sp. 190130A14a]|uniref:NERD domain-containing protein n=1 Tax=Tenacibaculum polynesiense TaxID=3137857 RepID=A0ABM9PDV6_9FLAO
MSLEAKSQELKDLVSTYDTQWFLGDLSGLMKSIASGRAQDQLGQLSSPMRQLYFLGGLVVSSDNSNGIDIQYTPEKWNKIVELLNQIEREYDKLFFPKPDEEIDEEWKKIRQVAMPSFLSYFNQGPLNYEEQTINWVSDLYSQLDDTIEVESGVKTEDFIQFYNNLDDLVQRKFQGFGTRKDLFQEEWLTYTKIQMGVVDEAPDFIKEMGEQNRPIYTFVADHGIINRFKSEDLVSNELSIEKINIILSLLTCKRKQSDFLYYTSTRPSNPLYEFPIVDIGEEIFQVFEVKQVIHAIDDLLERICSKNSRAKDKLIDKKGKLLENRIVNLFKKFFKKDYKCFEGYYVDGCEQDILFLWKNYAFIIEAKGYNLREPMRDPNKAFVKIKDDFKACIGYGHTQTKRVEQKFIDQVPLKIEDKNGNLIEEIDTTQYEENDFSIIVNINSFGQIQNDLSTLLEIEEDGIYPWVIKLDDLETFFLTMIAKKKRPQDFINYLYLREELHGKLICSDELEVCGGYLNGVLTEKKIEKADRIVTTPDLPEIFDKQYNKGMGFDNEKLLAEKKSGKYMFW